MPFILFFFQAQATSSLNYKPPLSPVGLQAPQRLTQLFQSYESNRFICNYFPCFSRLRQLEQSALDLTKIEAETKQKIIAVNTQKTSVVTALLTQMKVRLKRTAMVPQQLPPPLLLRSVPGVLAIYCQLTEFCADSVPQNRFSFLLIQYGQKRSTSTSIKRSCSVCSVPNARKRPKLRRDNSVAQNGREEHRHPRGTFRPN